MKKTFLAAFALLTMSASAFAQYGGPGRTDPRPQPGTNTYGNNAGYGTNSGYDNGYGNQNGSYNNGPYNGNNGQYGNNGQCGNNGQYGYGNTADPRSGNGYSYVRSHPVYRNLMAARLPVNQQRNVMRDMARIEQMEWAFSRNGRGVGPREQAVLNRELAQLDARLQRDYRRGYVRY
jgi:hypothetical protein